METNISNKCKAYTSLEQSKKLAEILPLESADMSWKHYVPDFASEGYGISLDTIEYNTDIPCWSLAALLDIIPYPTLGKHADETWSCTSWVEKVNPYFVEGCGSPIDACVAMIEKLHEQKLL